MDEQAILNGLGTKQVLGLAVQFQDPEIKQATTLVRDESYNLTRDQWAYYVAKAFPVVSTKLFALGNPNWWSVVHQTVSKAITYKTDLRTVTDEELEGIENAEQNYNQNLANKPGSDDTATRTEAAATARQNAGGGTAQTPVSDKGNVNPLPGQTLPQPEEKGTEAQAEETASRPSEPIVKKAEQEVAEKGFEPSLGAQIGQTIKAGFEGLPSQEQVVESQGPVASETPSVAPGSQVAETTTYTTVTEEPPQFIPVVEGPVFIPSEGPSFPSVTRGGGGSSPVMGMVQQYGGSTVQNIGQNLGGKVFARGGEKVATTVATKVAVKGAEAGAKKAGGAVLGGAAKAIAQFIPGLDVAVNAAGLIKGGLGLFKKLIPGLASKAKIGARKGIDGLLGLGGSAGQKSGGISGQADSWAQKIIGASVAGFGALVVGTGGTAALALIPIIAIVAVIVVSLFTFGVTQAAMLNTTAPTQAQADPSFSQGTLFSVRKTADTPTFANGTSLDAVYTVTVTATKDIKNVGAVDTMTRENAGGSVGVFPVADGSWPTTMTAGQSQSIKYHYKPLTELDNDSNLVNVVIVTATDNNAATTETLTAQATITVGTPNYTASRCPVATSGPCATSEMAKYFGADQADNASRICLKESGGKTDQVYDACTKGFHNEYSVGLFQVNLFAHDSLCVQAVGSSPFSKPYSAGCTYGVTCDACTPSRNEALLQQCADYWEQPDHNIQYAAQLFHDVGSHWYPTWSTAGPKYCNIP